jgi:FkbM family methyltransferase
MRVPYTSVEIPIGRFVAPLANRLPFPIVVPILHGPARGAKWILGSSEPNYWLRSYEKAKVVRFVDTLHTDSVFYDVGANVGYFSLIAAPRCRQVFAFEPFPDNVGFLRQHFRLNRFSNCMVVEAAVGDIDGSASFAAGGTRCEGRVVRDGALRVPSLRLDSFVKDNPPPHVIKIDVEGAELGVLEGAARILSEHHPTVFLATHSDALKQQCHDLLAQQSYQIDEIETNEFVATYSGKPAESRSL